MSAKWIPVVTGCVMWLAGTALGQTIRVLVNSGFASVTPLHAVCEAPADGLPDRVAPACR